MLIFLFISFGSGHHFPKLVKVFSCFLFQEMLEMVRMTCNIGTSTRERLISALDSLCEMTQDFTDSAYTPHHHREQILDFLEECRFELTNLLQPDVGHSS